MTTKAKADAVLALVAGKRAEAVRDPAANRRREPKNPPAARMPKIFLADNSRFRSNAYEQRIFIERLCARYGLAAEWPSEHFLFPTGFTIEQRQRGGLPIDDPAARRALPTAWNYLAACQAVVAEASAFRGPHMNPLIAFEVGVAVVHDIPIFAWTKDASADGKIVAMRERLRAQDKLSPDGNWRDGEGGLIENFDLVEFAAIAGNFVSVSTSRISAIHAAAAHLRAR